MSRAKGLKMLFVPQTQSPTRHYIRYLRIPSKMSNNLESESQHKFVLQLSSQVNPVAACHTVNLHVAMYSIYIIFYKTCQNVNLHNAIITSFHSVYNCVRTYIMSKFNKFIAFYSRLQSIKGILYYPHYQLTNYALHVYELTLLRAQARSSWKVFLCMLGASKDSAYAIRK